MTATPDDPDDNVLYELLPTVFRQRDIAQGYPLLALTKVFDHIRDRLAADISDLERDWFIQTCRLDYVPLIGALVGVEVAKPVRPEHRALVADTLAFRRRKGIALALPKLVRDSSGWYSIYSPGPETPASTWPLAGAVTAIAAAAPVPLPVGLLRVWRLPVFAVIDATPAPIAGTNFYCFNPLGMDQPLFNVPNTPLDWVAAAPVTALPVPLTTAMLAADLARYDATWPDANQGPANSLLYGPARGLVIRTQNDQSSSWIALQPGQIQARSLEGPQSLAPDYPVVEGGLIDLAVITPGICNLTITFGDATAALSFAIQPVPDVAGLVPQLQNAIENATIYPGVRVTVAAVQALQVGAVGGALAIVPTMSAAEPLSIAPPEGDSNPLGLDTTAQLGLAAATLSLTPQLIALLTGAPANSVMTFTAPAGQVLGVPLPLALSAPTVAAVAAAFAAALPTCFVCQAGDQVVIVPTPATPSPAAAATTPAQALGLVPVVAVDPELGRFSWPTGLGNAGTLSVDYGMAMPGAIGGVGLRALPPLPANPVMLADSGNSGWLQTQLSAWTQSKAACTVLMLQGSVTRAIGSQQLAPASGQSLWIVGASGSQPCVVTGSPGTLSLLGPAAAADSEPGAIAISGLTLEASIVLVGGAIDLTLRDTTLYPGTASLALAALPPSDVPSSDVLPGTPRPPRPPPPPPVVATLDMQRCVLGPIDLTAASGSIKIDSAVLSTLPQPDPLPLVLTLPKSVSAEFSRLTLIGGAFVAGTLHASDSLFDGVLFCEGQLRLNHCYVRVLSCPRGGDGDGSATASSAIVTRCATCGKARGVRMTNCLLRQLALGPGDGFCSCEDTTGAETRDCATCTDPACAETCPLRASGQIWDPIERPPQFDEPNRYPLPNFARLASDNSAAILAGAGNHDVLGSYNLAVPMARCTEFEAALRSALLPGVRLDRKFET
jgi:hypothetical protein